MEYINTDALRDTLSASTAFLELVSRKLIVSKQFDVQHFAGLLGTKHAECQDTLAQALRVQTHRELDKMFKDYEKGYSNDRSKKHDSKLSIDQLEAAVRRGVECNVQSANDFQTKLAKAKSEKAVKDLNEKSHSMPRGTRTKRGGTVVKEKAVNELIDAIDELMVKVRELPEIKSDKEGQTALTYAEDRLKKLRTESAKLRLRELPERQASLEEVQAAIDKATELGVDLMSIKRAEEQLSAAGLSFADDALTDYRIDPKKFEQMMKEREQKLASKDAIKYRKRLQEVKDKHELCNNNKACDFLMLRADKLRNSKLACMVPMQELQLQHQSWFVKFTVTLDQAVKQVFRKKILVVSQ
jgi:hypothetical protein